MRTINSALRMELNMTLKILAFCILSFQNSWHFAFSIICGTKHCVVVLPFFGNFMKAMLVAGYSRPCGYCAPAPALRR